MHQRIARAGQDSGNYATLVYGRPIVSAEIEHATVKSLRGDLAALAEATGQPIAWALAGFLPAGDPAEVGGVVGRILAVSAFASNEPRKTLVPVDASALAVASETALPEELWSLLARHGVETRGEVGLYLCPASWSIAEIDEVVFPEVGEDEDEDEVEPERTRLLQACADNSPPYVQVTAADLAAWQGRSVMLWASPC